MGRKRIYSYGLLGRVEEELPQRVKDAMDICGWNALGIYEIVDIEIKRERRDQKLKAAAKQEP